MTTKDLHIQRYAEWLTAQGAQYNFGPEIAALSNRTAKLVTNSVAPLELWHLMVPTVLVLNEVREKFGAVTVHSAYRSAAYNLAVGGVGDSQHSKNDALDFSCATGTPEDWGKFLSEQRARGMFMGGIGIYPNQRFVHVDTRGTRADWRGK